VRRSSRRWAWAWTVSSSLALFAASRTLFRRAFMRNAVRMKVGPEAMVGEEALVVEALSEEAGGTVRIHGELWMARTLSGALAEGERVVVEGVDGLKLWVRRRGAHVAQLQDSHRKEGVR
jgi:membrane protein implicated in regulation of membrane protease activity